MTWLLDTNVISELRTARTGASDPEVVKWAASVDPAELFISVITVQELEIGVIQAERRDAVRGAMLRDWFDRSVLPAFAERILAIDTAIARRSASLHVPDRRPAHDALIAATALVHGMTVVSRDADFAAMGVPLLNPWLPQS